MLSAVHTSCRGQWWESGIPIHSIQQECWSNPIPSAMGAPSEGAASVVFSWPAGLLPSTPSSWEKASFQSQIPWNGSEGEEIRHGIIREGASSLQPSLWSLASWPGCVCWSLLKEGSSPGKISLILLAASTNGSEVPAEIRIRSWGQTSQQ